MTDEQRFFSLKTKSAQKHAKMTLSRLTNNRFKHKIRAGKYTKGQTLFKIKNMSSAVVNFSNVSIRWKFQASISHFFDVLYRTFELSKI